MELFNWDEALIDKAEKEIEAAKRKKWMGDYSKKHPEDSPYAVSKAADAAEAAGSFKPKQGVVKVKHEHGFIVMDIEGFKALPKSQQNKILNLGGF